MLLFGWAIGGAGAGLGGGNGSGSDDNDSCCCPDGFPVANRRRWVRKLIRRDCCTEVVVLVNHANFFPGKIAAIAAAWRMTFVSVNFSRSRELREVFSHFLGCVISYVSSVNPSIWLTVDG